MKQILTTVVLLLTAISSLLVQNDREMFELYSPDGRNRWDIDISQSISADLYRDGSLLASLSGIQLQLNDHILGARPELRSVTDNSVDQMIQPVVAEKFSRIREAYNELLFDFGDFGIVFRAYNEGVAYRFITDFVGNITIRDEGLTIGLDPADSLYVSLEQQYRTHFERSFSHIPLSSFTPDSMAYTPLLVSKADGRFLFVSDAALDDYPGLWLKGLEDSPGLRAHFPAYPTETTPSGQVLERGNYLAKTDGRRSYPWRAFLTADHETDLITNQLIYLLGEPLQIEDTSWIEPGTVILDW